VAALVLAANLAGAGAARAQVGVGPCAAAAAAAANVPKLKIGGKEVFVGCNAKDGLVGSIVAFAGSPTTQRQLQLAEQGWLLADGRGLKLRDFAVLHNAIGDEWRVSGGGETFDIPDLRGRFLVGLSAGAKAGARADSKVGNDLGAKSSTHTVPRALSAGGCSGDCKGWTADSAERLPKARAKDQKFADTKHTHSVSLPPSKVVVYLIKVK
jgi:microcystin-dependent protein